MTHDEMEQMLEQLTQIAIGQQAFNAQQVAINAQMVAQTGQLTLSLGRIETRLQSIENTIKGLVLTRRTNGGTQTP